MRQPRQAQLLQPVEDEGNPTIFISRYNRDAITERAMYWARLDFAGKEITEDHTEMAGRAYWNLYQDSCTYDKKGTLTEHPGRLTDDMFRYEPAFIAEYVKAYIEVHCNFRKARMEAREARAFQPVSMVAER